MNNGAISRQTPTLLISRWLIDPNGNVYQRDVRDENIIILPRLIRVFKEGWPKGNLDVWDHRESRFHRLLGGFLSEGLRSLYSTYKRLWGIQYYIPKQFSKKIKHSGYGAPETGDAIISGGQILVYSSQSYPSSS